MKSREFEMGCGKLTGSDQNDHFVDLKPIINRASESVEQKSLFVHVSLAIIIIEYGQAIVWDIIEYQTRIK